MLQTLMAAVCISVPAINLKRRKLFIVCLKQSAQPQFVLKTE